MRRSAVIGLAIALAVTVLVEVLGPASTHASGAFWHGAPGWYALYGVAGCVALVAVAKTLGRLGLTRRERTEAADRALDPAEQEPSR